MCRDTVGWGEGVLTNWPTIATKKEKVTENAVANSLAAWLTLTNFLLNLRIFGGPEVPHSHFRGSHKKTALDKFKKVQMEELNAKTLFQSKVTTSEVWKCIFGFGKVTIQGGANVELGGIAPIGRWKTILSGLLAIIVP